MTFQRLKEWAKVMTRGEKLLFFPVFCISLSKVYSQKVSYCCMINTVEAFILSTGANAKNHGQCGVHKKLSSCKTNVGSQTVSTSICLHNCQLYQTQTVRQRSRACTKAFLYEVLLICKYTIGPTGSVHVQTQPRLPLPYCFNEGSRAAHQNGHRDGDARVMGQANGSHVCTAGGQWTSNCPVEQEGLRNANVILISRLMWVVNYSWDEIQASVKCVCAMWVSVKERARKREYVKWWVWRYNLVPYFH